MLNFKNITLNTFLQEYWQKKPILLKNAIKIDSPLTPDDMAGLCLEGVESRIILGNYKKNNWKIKNQPFADDIFTTLPDTDWTLLVQGLDRFIPEVYQQIKNFDFIPRWRFDDVMMSYATTGGSVGPHFDYYDVFLVQTSGSRKWQLSTKNCNEENYNHNFALKIMDKFETTQEFITETGDVLYIPPKVAHFGISLDDSCTTMSFGYRSYSSKELCEFVGQKITSSIFYQDPTWEINNTPALLPNSAIKQANKITKISADNFAKFITKTDLLDEKILQEQFEENFYPILDYILHPCLKITYTTENKVFIAGEIFNYLPNEFESIINFCNMRKIKGNNKLTKRLFNLGFLQTEVIK